MDDIDLTVDQAAEVLKMSKSTIRFYDKRFADYLEIGRSRGNQRRFTKDTIKRLLHIKHLLQEEGYTIQGARKKLNLRKAKL